MKSLLRSFVISGPLLLLSMLVDYSSVSNPIFLLAAGALTPLGGILMAKLLTLGRWKQIFLFAGIWIMMIILGALLASLTWRLILAVPQLQPLTESDFSAYQYAVFCFLYQTLLLVLVAGPLQTYFTKHSANFNWSAFSLIVLSQTMCLIVLWSFLLMPPRSLPSLVIFCFLAGVSLAGDLLLAKSFHHFMEGAELTTRISLMEQAQALQNAQYHAVSEQILDMRRLRHDYRNTLATISVLLDQGELAKARALISATDSAVYAQALTCTGNAVLDAVLTIKQSEAQKSGIRFSCSLLLPQSLTVPDEDLMRIFSNLLDNAIEACRNIPPEKDREIQVTNTLQGEMLLLRFTNTFYSQSAPPNLSSTSKGDRENHGHGLSIVKTIAKNHMGSLLIQTSATTVTISVLLAA